MRRIILEPGNLGYNIDKTKAPKLYCNTKTNGEQLVLKYKKHL
jgi:hypothetical protein